METIYGLNVQRIMKDDRLTYVQKVFLTNLLFLCNEGDWRGRERPMTCEFLSTQTGISVGEISEDIAVLKATGYIRATLKKQLINGRPRGHEMWHIALNEDGQPVPLQSYGNVIHFPPQQPGQAIQLEINGVPIHISIPTPTAQEA
jgi:hypothetical protein